MQSYTDVRPGRPTKVEHRAPGIHDQERIHMDLVWRALERLGADPTVQTSSADIDGVASMGLLQVVTDPRTPTTTAGRC